MNRSLPALLSAAALLISLTACAKTASSLTEDDSGSTSGVAVAGVSSVSEINHSYSASDTDADYDSSDTTVVTLSLLNDGVYRIMEGGTYVLSGDYEGQIVVEADDTDEVQLVLSEANIHCSDGPAIYVLSTDKLVLTLQDGTENSLSDGVDYARDEEGADGALYSKSDVSINGSGSLTVNGNTAHGIVSKDDLTITGGNITINAVKDGLRGKDCVAIGGGIIVINAGSDGVYSSETDEGKGYIAIDGGSVAITAGNDGIQAANAINITGGTLSICCGGGSATVTLAGDASGFSRSQYNGATIAEDSSESYKGLKSGGSISITDGSFAVDTADDAIHAAGGIEITGGEFLLRSGDDAIHSDENVLIGGGSFTIPYCYEGVEGLGITVTDGVFDIVSSDDGFNAAGGVDGSGLGGGWDDPFAVQDDCAMLISGGTITVVSDGDCLDSNGTLTISGGTLKLTCNGNGNTAVDCSGAYTHSSGSVTTNDGSESTGGGGMGGGMNGGGKGGGMGGGRP